MKTTLDLCIIEDSEIDQFLIQQEIKELGTFQNIKVFSDSEKALQELINSNERGEKFADLILLDLHMPLVDGLEWIDSLDDENIENLPVIFVLSNSLELRDHEKFERQKLATEFISKPLKSEKLKELIAKYFH